MKQLKYKFTLLLILILAFTSNTLKAQNQQDVSSIKSMCGCFEVEFNFSETFSYSEDSTYLPSPEKTAGALEWAQLVSESNDKVVIQHLLLVGNPEKPMIIKHWRQDWLYQNDNLYEYNGDNMWNYKKLSSEQVKGQWTQKVYQVDDSPRYEGSASWVHVDNKNYWENTTPAPLPRREYTQRSDYNLTLRTNRHEVVKNGWVHDQDNSKILREQDKDDFELAKEKGTNYYVRVDDQKCAAAAEWWNENNDYWSKVRSAWEEIYSQNKNLILAKKVEGKRLYEILFDMDTKTSKKKISKIISSFIVK